MLHEGTAKLLFLIGIHVVNTMDKRTDNQTRKTNGSHVGGVSKVCIDIETTQKGEEEVEERSDKKRKNKESESDESEDTEQVFTSKKDKENLEGEKESTKVGKGRNAGMGIPGVPRGIETISEVHNVSLSPGGFVGNEIEPFDGMPVVSTPKRLSKKSTKSKTKLRKQHKFPLDIWKLPVEEIPEPHKVSLRPGDLPGKGLGGFHGSPLKVSGAKSKSDVGEANILGLPLDNVSVSQNVSFQPRDFGEIGIDGIDNMSFVNAPKSTSKRLNRIVEDERDKLSRQDAPNTPSRNVTYDTLMSNVTEPKKVAETDPVAQILPAAKQLKESKYRQKPLRLPVGTQQIDSCQKDASQEQVSHFESRREGKCEKTIPRDVVRQVLKQIAGDLPTDVNDVIRQYVKMDEFPSKCESWRDTFRRSRKDDDYHRGIFRQQPSPDSSKKSISAAEEGNIVATQRSSNKAAAASVNTSVPVTPETPNTPCVAKSDANINVPANQNIDGEKKESSSEKDEKSCCSCCLRVILVLCTAVCVLSIGLTVAAYVLKWPPFNLPQKVLKQS